MPIHQTEIFLYDNIHFENGKKDSYEHPVVIAGADENNIYCFTMTSQTKHLGKNSQIRNIYNKTIKYAETIPGKNCSTNNFIKGLVNTTQCIIIPKEKAKEYANFGYVTQQLLTEIIAKWFYQQNEIMDKPQYQFECICTALGITNSIKSSKHYLACENLMRQNPNELQIQREYEKNMRRYREECLKIRRQNTNNIYRGQKPLPFPKEPKLQDDKSFYKKYEAPQYTEEEQLASSPFAGLANTLFGKKTIQNKESTINLEEKRQELLELKEMLQASASQEPTSYQGKKAA